MISIKKIGKVKVSHDLETESGSKSCLVEWSMPDLFYRPEKDSQKECRSDSFKFAGESWHLLLSTGGDSIVYSDLIQAYLVKELSPSECCVQWKMGLKRNDGTIATGRTLSGTFRAGERNKGWVFLTRSEFEHHKSKLAPSCVLTITCSIRIVEPDSPVTSAPNLPLMGISDLLKDWPTSPSDPAQP